MSSRHTQRQFLCKDDKCTKIIMYGKLTEHYQKYHSVVTKRSIANEVIGVDCDEVFPAVEQIEINLATVTKMKSDLIKSINEIFTPIIQLLHNMENVTQTTPLDQSEATLEDIGQSNNDNVMSSSLAPSTVPSTLTVDNQLPGPSNPSPVTLDFLDQSEAPLEVPGLGDKRILRPRKTPKT